MTLVMEEDGLYADNVTKMTESSTKRKEMNEASGANMSAECDDSISHLHTHTYTHTRMILMRNRNQERTNDSHKYDFQ